MILYRPVSLGELQLIYRSGMTAFPPRLPSQPIFYPVVELEYASKIAKEWNASPGFAGFVTRFEVEDEYVKRYPVQVAGGNTHTELWVPAEELPEFNQHILGVIEVVKVFLGKGFKLQQDGRTETEYVESLLVVSKLEGWSEAVP